MAKGAALYEVLGEVAKSGGSSTATSATDLPGLLPAGQVFVCPEESLFYSQAVEKLVLSRCVLAMHQLLLQVKATSCLNAKLDQELHRRLLLQLGVPGCAPGCCRQSFQQMRNALESAMHTAPC
jgi:hypothetical protein